ncbi:cyclase family protein [Catenuloplanes japonicus]|uniref:cyclase family protein n=1 Tax=Catenuloplanes japonicus TaxID=33876 RepID=UPI0005267B32|nr:cyclase family protein [Catenuloplanes japonicus]
MAIDFPSNWGRWGDADERGAVNLIDDEARARGAAEARTGVTVSIARLTRPSPLTGGPMASLTASSTAVQTAMMFTGSPAMAMAELMIITTHHPEVTHLDAMAHWIDDGRTYPGVALADSAGPGGVRHGAAHVYGGGILTRGVLLDLAPGGGRLDPAHPITAADLDAAAARAGTEVLPGDAIVTRTGWNYVDDDGKTTPGMTLGAVRWMHEHGVAIWAGDVGDGHPPIKDEAPGALHRFALGRLAIPLIDAADPDELAQVCAELGRWTFQFVVAPPRIAGTTGVPVNPLAIF